MDKPDAGDAPIRGTCASGKTAKAQQIPLMRTIYERATAVIVWLGPQEDDSDLAMDLLRELSDSRT